MADSSHVVDLSTVISIKGAEAARSALDSFFQGVAADARKAAESVAVQGGDPRGVAERHAATQVQNLRTGLEQQLAQGVASGQYETGRGSDAEKIRGFLSRTFKSIPQSLGPLIQEAEFQAQKEIRQAVAKAGSGGGVIPPTLPPTAMGKGVPPDPQRPGRTTSVAAQEYARDQGKAVRERTDKLRALQESGFAREQAENVRAGYQLHQAVLGELASTKEYSQAKARAAKYQAQINAGTQETLSRDYNYARAQAQITRYKAVQEAQQQHLLAQDDRYTSAQATVARSKAEQSAKLQETLAIDDRYLGSTARAATAKALVGAQVQELLAKDDLYAEAQVMATRAKAEQAVKVHEALALDDKYLGATAQVTTARAAVNAQVQELLAKDGIYAEAQARAATAKQTQTARTQEALLADGKYAEASARATAARDRVATQVAQAQLSSPNLAAHTDRRLAEENLRTNRDVQYNQGLLNDPFLILQQAAAKELAEAVKRQRDIALETARMDETALAETAQLTALKRERRALEEAGVVGLTRGAGESIESLAGRTAAHEEGRAATRRIAQLHEIEANTNGIRDEIVQQRVLEARINRELEQEARAIRRAGTPGGRGILTSENTSWFQRVQATIQTRRSGDVVDADKLMGLGQFVTSRAVTTAGFALSGAVLYGGVQLIKQMVEESEKLQRVFSTIQAQFKSVGQEGEFAGFRSAMFDISRESGVAASEVATVGFQLKGVYGTDTQRAIKETAGAIKVAVVTGIEQKELTDSLTAASLAYGQSIESIGDEAVGLEERFGVLAKESLKVFGDMSAVAKEAGLSLKELGAIVGTIQQASGRSGQSVGEALGRILPGIQKQALPLLQLYQETPALQDSAPAVQQALAAGETGKVLTQLTRDWNKLDQTTKNYVVTLLGGRREASTLIPLFNNAAKAVTEMDRAETDSGKVSQRFLDLQNTLALAVNRFRAEMTKLGNDLLKLGLLDAFRDLAVAGGVMIRVLDQLVQWFGSLNSLAQGIPGRMIAIALAIAAVYKAVQLLQALRTQGLVQTIVGPVVQAAQRAAGGAGAAAGGAGALGTEAAVAAGAGAAAAAGAAAQGERMTAGGIILPAGVKAEQGIVVAQEETLVVERARTLEAERAAAAVRAAHAKELAVINARIVQLEEQAAAEFTHNLAFPPSARAAGALRVQQTQMTAAMQLEAEAASAGARRFADGGRRLPILGPGLYSTAPGAITEAEIAAASYGGAATLAGRAIPLGAGAGTTAADLAALYTPIKAARPGLGTQILGSGIGSMLVRMGTGGLLARGAGLLPGITAGGAGAAALGAVGALGIGAVELIAAQKLMGGGITLPEFLGGHHFTGRAEVQKQTADARKAAEERLRGGSLQGLLAARERGEFGTSSIDTLRAAGIGQSTTQSVANRIINEKTLEQTEQAVKLGLFSTFSEKELKELREHKGGGEAGKRARRLLVNLAPEQQSRLRTALGVQRTKDDALDDILKNGGKKMAEDMNSLATQFQMGNIGFTDYEAGLRRQLALVQSIDTNPETHAQLIQIQQAINGALANRTQAAMQTLQQIDQMQGASPGTGQAVAYARSRLAHDTAIRDQREQNKRVRRMGEVVDPEAAAFAAQDMLTPEEASAASNFLYQQARQEWMDRLNRAPNAAARQAILNKPPELDAATKKAIRDDYKLRTGLDLQEDPSIKASYDEQQQQRQIALQEVQAKIGAKYAGSRDPQAAVNSAKEMAAAQMKDAQRKDATATQLAAAQSAVAESTAQQLDVDRQIADAKTDLMAAQHPDDIIAQARGSQQKAATAAKYAQGEAAKLEAEAQRLAADRQMEDALNLITDSRIKLLQTHLSIAGDEIGAAHQGVILAQNALDRARTRGASENELNDLQGQLEQQKDQERETTLRSREEIIDFNLNMKRITVGQAIAQLEALMSIANPKEQRELMLRIKALRDQAGQDLQFNIPDEIKLPTLYEVRRSLQTPEGQGYNDHRQVSVVMHVNNGMDQASATKWLTDTVGTSPRVVSRGRRIP